MGVNWKMEEAAWGSEPLAEDFDDYGRGEYHRISVGDEVEVSDQYGCTHSGVVLGIIRDINRVPVCYKIWDETHKTFDYVQASDSILCEPCGSSQWSLERIGYVRCACDDEGWSGYYRNEQTGDVIYW